MIRHKPHPYPSGCPLCSDEYQRNARPDSLGDLSDPTSPRSYIFLAVAVLISGTFLAATFVFPGVLP